MNISNEFEPLQTLLRIAQERHKVDDDSYIHIVVRDAQIIRHHPERTRILERATYRYAVTLGRSNASFLDSMNASNLTEKDIICLLDFFAHI